MNPMLALPLVLLLGDAVDRPQPGDVAPSFSLSASSGKTVTLADFAGKKTVVLAFFPKAFTGG
jgi:peroxiredoxin Q/BCP